MLPELANTPRNNCLPLSGNRPFAHCDTPQSQRPFSTASRSDSSDSDVDYFSCHEQPQCHRTQQVLSSPGPTDEHFTNKPTPNTQLRHPEVADAKKLTGRPNNKLSPRPAKPLPTSRSLPAKLSRAAKHDLNLKARQYSERFPEGHHLHPKFVQKYKLEAELGAGGYGFVLTARNREKGFEAAVKFIIKSKIPEHAWVKDTVLGKLPAEAVFMSAMDHPNIVKVLDFYQDSVYYYLVQELHGSPWKRPPRNIKPCRNESPPREVPGLYHSNSQGSSDEQLPSTPTDTKPFPLPNEACQGSTLETPRPTYGRRPSHDLFECIESSKEKRLNESQARYIFRQVVDAISFLHSQGICHRDIKDENIVIDKDLRVKLIDFGSATYFSPDQTAPYYTHFFGTTAYAASEILRKEPYQAPSAEVWTLGVLLSFLLTGASPFASTKDAIEGRITLADCPVTVSKDALHMMKICLHPNPEKRATMKELREHSWLESYQLS